MEKPLVLEFGLVFGITRVIEVVQDFENPFTVAQGQPAVHAIAVCGIYGRTDEVIVEEVFDRARGIGAEDAVGLEEEEMFCGS